MNGLMSEQLRVLLRWFKEGPPGAIPLVAEGPSRGALQAVTWEDAGDGEALARLAAWHRVASAAPSREALRQWLTREVLPAEKRALFWVKDAEGRFVGHVGLARFDFLAGEAVVGDVLGKEGSEPLLSLAVAALGRWLRETFGLRLVEPGRALAA